MNKVMARIVALVCTVGTLFLVFQIRFVKEEEGGPAVIYTVPGHSKVGAEEAAELQAMLEEKHGQAHTDLDIGTATHLGQPVQVLETLTYGVDFLGQSFGGKRYLFCIIESDRKLQTDESDPVSAQKMISYMAIDPAGDDPAEVLWDTVQVKYKPDQRIYDSLAGK